MTARTTIAVDGANHEITDEFLSHVLETAVEGACSDWADVNAESAGDVTEIDAVGDFDEPDYVEEDDTVADDNTDRLSYTAASFVVSKDPTQGGTLDLQGVADAIERIVSGEVEVPPAIREIILAAVRDEDASNIDAEAADCIVQVGLFDEIVYR